MVTLRWATRNWEKAPLMCRLFGHIWRSGWWGDQPYLTPEPGTLDNLDTHHVRLTRRCDRCEKTSTVAFVHDWAKPHLGAKK